MKIITHKNIAIIAFLLIMVTNTMAEPIGNEYGYANAWFNGQEKLVEGVKLKVDEPAEIKITVTSNISGHVTLGLSNPLVTNPYTTVEGVKIDERIDNYNVPAGWSKTFIWKLKPNGAWTNGNAPINVLITFYNVQSKEVKPVEFTIANPYILPERFEGAPTSTAPTATGSATAVPGYEGIAAIAALAGAAVMRRL